MATLRAHLAGSPTMAPAALQERVRETLRLAWALKGYAHLEAVDYQRGGAAVAGGGVRGGSGTIPDLGGAAALMGGTGEQVLAHFARMLDRRRQAEAAGINYPNADVGKWLFCFRCPPR